ncbi:MAG TPA: TolC family protein [Cyanobacteria bacterium UBA8530]|nr:TolC family protein [Cyanobacteria bacterium UBA8530]
MNFPMIPMISFFSFFPLTFLGLPAFAAEPVLTLAQSLRTAQANQPQLVRAQAAVLAAAARSSGANAPLLPQVSFGASYNQPWNRGGTAFVPGSALNLRANQLIWDFGQRTNRLEAAKVNVGVQQQTEKLNQQQVALGVRTNFFAVRSAQVLVEVAQEAFNNQKRHLSQITIFVGAGTRPPIDLAQGRRDLANAQVKLINAQNAYKTSKAQLNQAMGVSTSIDYSVANESMPAIQGEEQPLEALVREAETRRPDLAAIAEQVRSQELTLAAQKGANSPVIQASAGLSDSGLGGSPLNWDAGISLSTPLYDGGSIRAQTSEAEANLISLNAQADALRQQVRLELTQARLAIESEKLAIRAAAESVRNAREQLVLAEGRYEVGVGNIIELDDAQLSLTSAKAQQVQEDFKLATARAQLLKAIGREP